MAEFIEGSGFYPPTFNSVTIKAENTGLIGLSGTIHEFKIAAPDRMQISSLSYYYEQVSTTALPAFGGTIDTYFEHQNTILFHFQHVPYPAGNGLYAQQTYDNQSFVLEKGETIGFRLVTAGGGGGSPTILITVQATGQYIL